MKKNFLFANQLLMYSYFVLPILAVVVGGILSLSGRALAGRDTKRENCFYDGVKLSPAVMKETETIKRSISPEFSGHVICFDVRKKKKKESFFLVGGIKNGTFRKFDVRTGKILKEGTYRSGKMHGQVLQYDHRNGKLQRKMNYHEGKMAGVQTDYYSESGLRKRVYWVGKGPKTSIQFTKKGNPSTVICGVRSVMPEDVLWCGRDGRRGKVTLYSNTEKKSRIHEYLNGQKDGQQLTFDRSGKVKRLEIFKAGKKESSESFRDGKKITSFKFNEGREGKIVAFFPNSKQKQSETVWKKGNKVSEITFYENGKVSFQAKYKTDKTVNISRYDDKGELLLIGNYKKIKSWYWYYLAPHGAVRRYQGKELLLEENNYENGSLHGITRYFDSKGELTRKENYKKGILITSEDYSKEKMVRKIEYYDDGSLKKEILGTIEL